MSTHSRGAWGAPKTPSDVSLPSHLPVFVTYTVLPKGGAAAPLWAHSIMRSLATGTSHSTLIPLGASTGLGTERARRAVVPNEQERQSALPPSDEAS